MNYNKKAVTIIRNIIMSLLALFLTFIAAGQSFKMDKMGRNNERKQCFDFSWKFMLEDFPNATQPNFNDKNWRELNLPHDWSIEGKTDINNPTGNDGGYFPAGTGWYRKNFAVPLDWKGQKVSIYFEGVYMDSKVYINGNLLGLHPYGYTSFKYDLTPYLKFGEKNLISVRVDNSQQKNCRWYSGSGIYRHVWLIVTPLVHLGHWGIAFTTPEVNKEKAIVRVKTVVKNETNLPQSIILSTKIFDKSGNCSGRGKIHIELTPNSNKQLTQNIEVAEPLLWTPNNPNLYSAQSLIQKNNRTIDLVNSTFGIRSIKFSAKSGFELNGRILKLNGGCVHHDNGILGAAAYDRAEERRVELLKLAGFNAIRTSHNPPSESFLDACDKLGLMVIDESFDGWREKKNAYDYASIFNDWWQRDIAAMVLRDRNHPSVIMWSDGNEIIERTKPEAVSTAKMLNSYIRKLDPSRPVTSAMTTWNQGWQIFDSLMATYDVCGYNYQMQHAESDHKRVPSRIIVQTESYPKDAFYNWSMVQNHNYIIGDFVWTAMDYLGESGIGGYYYPWQKADEHYQSPRYPWHGAYCGEIDLTGWRKPISHYHSLLWNGKEKLYMAVKEPNPNDGPIKTTDWAVWPTWESWNWPGYEGKNVQVEVDSRYPEVRLYLNNKLIGTHPTSKKQEFKTIFTIPYMPGVLRAVGLNAGKEIESTILRTAGKAAQIRLTADRKIIKANGEDLSFITVEIRDKEGNKLPNAENQLLFSLKGKGVIVGMGNANLRDPEAYVNDRCRTWKGRALVVVKSDLTPDTLRLTVSSIGLPDASLMIKTVKN